MEQNIKPNWLRVDKATIFFISISHSALTLAKNIVATPRKKIVKDKEILPLNRNTKYTPAVTNVEEWTKEDTGVGAAIAAGNQAEKGT